MHGTLHTISGLVSGLCFVHCIDTLNTVPGKHATANMPLQTYHYVPLHPVANQTTML
jgi:hypothetical protein